MSVEIDVVDKRYQTRNVHTDGVNFISKIERRERNNIQDEIFAIISE